MISDWPSGSRSRAIRICQSTRSVPVISSVTALEPGIHLHEVVAAVIDDEFDGSRPDIADGLGGGDGGQPQLRKVSRRSGAGASSTTF